MTKKLKKIVPIMMVLLALSMLSTSFRIQTVKAQTTANLIPVPFYWGYGGVAAGSLEMVFNYYGEFIPQDEIGCVARVNPNDRGTHRENLRRAAQFSNISTSMGDILDHNITGYTARQLGYSASEASGLSIATLKSFLDQGKPLIVDTWLEGTTHGTYRVAIGYDEDYIYFNDEGGGPDFPMDWGTFYSLWVFGPSPYWALYVSPWLVNVSAPEHIEPRVPFQVEATVTYPQALSSTVSNAYPAGSCKATIALPGGLNLASGETQTKTLGMGFMQQGGSYTTSWTLIANSSVSGAVNVTAEGIIYGSVNADTYDNVPLVGYSYTDRIGGIGSFPINIKEPHEITAQIMPCKNIIGQGYGNEINVTVVNSGEYNEIFNVTVSANQTVIGIIENLTLPVSMSSNVTFTLNTTGFVYGNYTLTVCASTVTGAINTFSCPITITIPGDIDGNFKVGLPDLVAFAQAYGSTPSSPNWNPNADIDGNGMVGLSDLVILATHYGQHYS